MAAASVGRSQNLRAGATGVSGLKGAIPGAFSMLLSTFAVCEACRRSSDGSRTWVAPAVVA